MTVTQNLKIRQGESWEFSFVHLDRTGAAVDLTGWRARMTMRVHFAHALEAFLSDGQNDRQGEISLSADGTVTLQMSAPQTLDLLDITLLHHLELTKDRGYSRFETLVYDLELVDTEGAVTRALHGLVEIERGITSQ